MSNERPGKSKHGIISAPITQAQRSGVVTRQKERYRTASSVLIRKLCKRLHLTGFPSQHIFLTEKAVAAGWICVTESLILENPSSWDGDASSGRAAQVGTLCRGQGRLGPAQPRQCNFLPFPSMEVCPTIPNSFPLQ